MKTFQFNCPKCGDLVLEVKGEYMQGVRICEKHSKQGHTAGGLYQCLKCFELLGKFLDIRCWKEVDN